jgi:TRAP-type mannitol/chloroaromatic compound transport system permease small subunit
MIPLSSLMLAISGIGFLLKNVICIRKMQD